ncbi:hypothetical protein VTK73DRAFT_3202 [Phialemonium thermophilum]|uniref:Uncharacterized protein n=1 Tax=Phialemonium thermophilum TaxID=223376 RepID=A0ABR3X0I5_9PEZI
MATASVRDPSPNYDNTSAHGLQNREVVFGEWCIETTQNPLATILETTLRSISLFPHSQANTSTSQVSLDDRHDTLNFEHSSTISAAVGKTKAILL